VCVYDCAQSICYTEYSIEQFFDVSGSSYRGQLPTNSTGLIERVTTFKLLGINFEANLSWSLHINTTAAKASKHLYFLKQLKTAGLPTDQLLHFYVAVIRPVVEYCTPVWHYAINRAQAEQLESIQMRAIRIIFPFTCGLSYSYILFAANLISLDSRRHDLSKSFFQDIC